MAKVSVRTTQNVFIEYPIASLGDRILAFLIDGLIITAYFFLIFFVMIGVMEGSGKVAMVSFIIMMLPVFFYHLLFEIFMNGQSPGKRQLHIKVIRLDGMPATVGNYMLRWLFRLVEDNGLGILFIAVSSKGQRLGDMAAGTTVIKLNSPDVPNRVEDISVVIQENYQTVFQNVATLSDQDIEIVRQALEVTRDTGNRSPVDAAALRVQARLAITTDMPPVKFLHTILKDFNHVMKK